MKTIQQLMEEHERLSKILAWDGYDLDATTARWDKWSLRLGDPIPAMVDRVEQSLRDGVIVKWFTARAWSKDDPEMLACQLKTIHDWSLTHFGQAFEATAEKDPYLRYFYDDKAFQVVPNTGILVADDNRILRKMMWLNHGCDVSALYGDDGQMQCSRCLIDFKNMPASVIEQVFHNESARSLAQARVAMHGKLS